MCILSSSILCDVQSTQSNLDIKTTFRLPLKMFYRKGKTINDMAGRTEEIGNFGHVLVNQASGLYI